VQQVVSVDDERAIEWMEWSDDGQLLGAVSSTGAVHVYLSKLTILGDSFGSHLIFLSSLLEVTIVNVSEDINESLMMIRIDVEPSLVSIGPFHAAVTMNNRAWFYSLTGNEPSILREREYVGIIKCLKLNGDYVAALFANGTVHLHLIENESSSGIASSSSNREGKDYERRDVKSFPESGGSSLGGRITTLCLTNDFLIFATDSGSIEFFILEDWAMVNVYRHSNGVKMIAADSNGVRLALIDERNDAYIYNATNDFILPIPAQYFPTGVKSLLWETWIHDKGVFVVNDSKHSHVFIYVRDTIDGPSVEFVGKTKIPSSQFPLLLYNGVIVTQTQSGKASNFVLSTHDFAEKMNQRDLLKNEYLRDILKLNFQYV